MDKASEVIFSLQPVTFHYKKDLDPEAVPQFGLVAEQVAKVDSDLVARDAKGNPYTVRYEEVNAMLLNEFLKEHRTVEEQGAIIRRQRKDFEAAIAQQQKEIEALTMGLQKVSAQLEVSKPAPQVVVRSP
jgi:Chaperone of endosialidase